LISLRHSTCFVVGIRLLLVTS